MDSFLPTPSAGCIRSLSELKFLKPEHLAMIDEALETVGEYGQVRLVVEKGRLRFLVLEKSLDVLKVCLT